MRNMFRSIIIILGLSALIFAMGEPIDQYDTKIDPKSLKTVKLVVMNENINPLKQDNLKSSIGTMLGKQGIILAEKAEYVLTIKSNSKDASDFKIVSTERNSKDKFGGLVKAQSTSIQNRSAVETYSEGFLKLAKNNEDVAYVKTIKTKHGGLFADEYYSISEQEAESIVNKLFGQK